MSNCCVQKFPADKIMEAAKNSRLLVLDLEVAPDKVGALSLEEIYSLIRQAAGLGMALCNIVCRESVECEKVKSVCGFLQELKIKAAVELPAANADKNFIAELAAQGAEVYLYCKNMDEVPPLDEVASFPAGSVKLLMLPAHDGCADYVVLYKKCQACGVELTAACMTANAALPGEELTCAEQELIEKSCNTVLPGCLQLLCACSVTFDGKVYPCFAMGTLLGDVKESPLEEIYIRSKVLSLHREHPKRCQEPCLSCAFIDRCTGCAARAYAATGNYMAADGACSRNQKQRELINHLPAMSQGMLPHAERMLLIDRIVCLTELYSVHEAVVRQDNPFLRSDGVLEPNALPEYAAQAAALRDSVECGGKPSPGLLCEVSKTNFFNEVRVGDLLKITVRTEYNMDIWYGIKFTILANDKIAAEGSLKLCIYNDQQLPY